ncbi:MAG: outer membrane lipoprotein-sorting protein [Planctomycetota bacterium]|nr:MAG: outer membrane lipoprotein-sorting protein [Planctomycetota bacterium]
MKTKSLIIVTLCAGIFALCAQAADKLTVGQIVEKANFTAYYQGANGRARVKMNIVDSQGRTRQREMTILRWDAPKPKQDENIPKNKEYFAGEQKFYVFFHKPADVDKMAFLVWKHLDKDDDRWLYLPNLDLVKRIAGSEKRTSFVGSDFFYEDISGRNIAYDKHELAETTKNYYILKSTPKEPKSVNFNYYKTWIHRKTFLVIKTEYYDQAGRAYRKYEAKAVKQIQGYWTVTKSRMTNLRTNRYTDVIYSTVKYDTGIPESVFSERYLRRPPTKYLEN